MTRLVGWLARLIAGLALAGVLRPWERHAPPDPAAARAATHSELELLPGWSRPKPATSPEPTYWPFVFALGIMFIMYGMVTSIFAVGLGLILFFWALWGWIGDLLDEA